MVQLFVSRRLLATTAACLLALAPAAALAQDATPPPSAEPLSEPTPEAAAIPVTSPEGTWVVTELDAWGEGLAEPLPGSRLRLSFLGDSLLQGETACGRFDGGWSGTGSEIFVGVSPTGHLGCAQEQTAEAIGLSTALDAVVGWQPDDIGGIELLDAAGMARLVLEPFAVGDPIGSWEVQRFLRPNGEFGKPAADHPITLELMADGLLEGSTGCRLLLGVYSFDAGDMTVGPFDTSGLPCEGAVQKAERRDLRALGQVTTWQQSGDSLTLSSETEPVVELGRAPEIAPENAPGSAPETGE